MVTQVAAASTLPHLPRKLYRTDDFRCTIIANVHVQEIVSRSLQERIITEDQQLMAVISAKNCVHRRWAKRSAARSLEPAEKAIVRTAAVQLAASTEGGLAAQLCTLVAQIAKLDWPMAWPDVVQTITEQLREAANALGQ